MFQSSAAGADPDPTRFERLRRALDRRPVRLLLALAVEALLVLLLLTLGRPTPRPAEPVPMSEFTITPDEPVVEPDPAPPAPAAPAAAPARAPADSSTPPPPAPADTPPLAPPVPAPVQPPAPTSLPAPIIPMTREALDSADIGRSRAGPPAPARRAAVGPADTPFAGDTPRAEGRGPNGEPLYAAAWYREPYDSELSGYLSTAKGPGWGVIACRTVADFRVDDCVAQGEYPEGSNIARAVLAAAWQFRVRPPQLRGRYKVGEWVRIRITYGRER